MLNVFTKESGRVRLMIEGACSKHSDPEDAPQPFTPLLVHFDNRDKVRALRSTEVVSLALPLSGITFYNGLYVNGFIPRVLEYEIRFSELFFDYLYCVQALTGANDSPEPALRRFELALLGHPGYSTDLLHRANNGEPVDDIMAYRYCKEKGFIASLATGNNTFAGYHLKALASRRFSDVGMLHVARCFTRIALRPYLGSKSLKSRELFHQFMSA